jgi:tetratricopeptide (TPR) repeat protein
MRTRARDVAVRVVLVSGLVGCATHVIAPSSPPPEAVTDDAARSAYARALLAAERGDTVGAARELAWLARLDSSVWGALAVGRLHLRLGDAEAAAASVERAVSLQAADPRVQRALAEVRAAQGRTEDARDAWVAAARAGDEDAWTRALEGADGERAAAIVRAWGGAPISGRLRAARAAAEMAADLWGPATLDWEPAMSWTATPDHLRAWAMSFARAGCVGADPSAWMDTHPPADLGAGWAEAWGDACVALRPCEPFDEARQCLDRALEVTPPGLQRSRLVEARDQLELQRR